MYQLVPEANLTIIIINTTREDEIDRLIELGWDRKIQLQMIAITLASFILTRGKIDPNFKLFIKIGNC